MNKTRALMLLVPLLACSVARGQSSSLAFRDVTVIDVAAGLPKRSMTVVVQGNRIVSLGRSGNIRIPKNARVIEGNGKFLVPGLWDMHVHLGTQDFDRNSYLPLFIANGVTGIRIMDGSAEFHLWRKEIESGKLTGPRMVIASEVIGFGNSSNLSSAAVVAAVRKAKRDGASFIKVHDAVLRPSYFALSDEARRLGLTVQGHVPASVSAVEASNAGQKSIEHATGLDEAKSDSRKAHALISAFKRNRTWLCPTLIMRSNYAVLDESGLANDPRLKYVKPSWRNRWLKMTKAAANTPLAEWSNRRETIRKEKLLVGKMNRAGIGILAGTDDGNPYSLVGFGLHDELVMLVESGLTSLEALRAATINPAKFFNQLNSRGTIEKGKIADLVLLEANPLDDIRNIRQIDAVVVNGKYFPREALNQILAAVEAAAKN